MELEDKQCSDAVHGSVDLHDLGDTHDPISCRDLVNCSHPKISGDPVNPHGSLRRPLSSTAESPHGSTAEHFPGPAVDQHANGSTQHGSAVEHQLDAVEHHCDAGKHPCDVGEHPCDSVHRPHDSDEHSNDYVERADGGKEVKPEFKANLDALGQDSPVAHSCGADTTVMPQKAKRQEAEEDLPRTESPTHKEGGSRREASPQKEVKKRAVTISIPSYLGWPSAAAKEADLEAKKSDHTDCVLVHAYSREADVLCFWPKDSSFVKQVRRRTAEGGLGPLEPRFVDGVIKVPPGSYRCRVALPRKTFELDPTRVKKNSETKVLKNNDAKPQRHTCKKLSSAKKEESGEDYYELDSDFLRVPSCGLSYNLPQGKEAHRVPLADVNSSSTAASQRKPCNTGKKRGPIEPSDDASSSSPRFEQHANRTQPTFHATDTEARQGRARYLNTRFRNISDENRPPQDRPLSWDEFLPREPWTTCSPIPIERKSVWAITRTASPERPRFEGPPARKGKMKPGKKSLASLLRRTMISEPNPHFEMPRKGRSKATCDVRQMDGEPRTTTASSEGVKLFSGQKEGIKDLHSPNTSPRKASSLMPKIRGMVESEDQQHLSEKLHEALFSGEGFIPVNEGIKESAKIRRGAISILSPRAEARRRLFFPDPEGNIELGSSQKSGEQQIPRSRIARHAPISSVTPEKVLPPALTKSAKVGQHATNLAGARAGKRKPFSKLLAAWGWQSNESIGEVEPRQKEEKPTSWPSFNGKPEKATGALSRNVASEQPEPAEQKGQQSTEVVNGGSQAEYQNASTQTSHECMFGRKVKTGSEADRPKPMILICSGQWSDGHTRRRCLDVVGQTIHIYHPKRQPVHSQECGSFLGQGPVCACRSLNLGETLKCLIQNLYSLLCFFYSEY
ncbi:uncharacterized protein LOC144115731 isoform X2 [Amblyomma americanum]